MMINQTKTTVIFACPQCNLAHEVTQTHSHTKKAGGFDCAECGAAVHFWYGCFVYSDWRAMTVLPLLQRPNIANDTQDQQYDGDPFPARRA
jgi:transcription elongation factor Elf1